VTREIPSASMLVSDSRVDTALLDALKAKLRASVSTVLIAYFVTGGDVYAWVIRSEGIVLRKLPIEARELADRTAAMYNRLATPQANWQAPARQLYSALLEPLEDLLPRTVSGASRPRIGILPHATVNLVPFAALVDGQSRVLVQRFDIFYSPSLRTYLRSSQPLDRRAVVEAFGFNGDVLSHAEKEAEAVTTAGHVRVGAAVTRAAVLHAAATSDIVHLATHATQDSANPFGARLYVSDGALTLSDLLGVTWRTRLVTLSACDTAAGRVTTADEFTGISRGLLAAGVPQVLVTAWRVDDDSTATFMKRFYEALSTAHDAVSALGDAQRATVTGTGDAAHPGFWAPFVIVGADR